SAAQSAAQCEAVFGRAGWTNWWRNGIFAYHHYHSTAHEVLAIARGHARVQFGGEQGEIVPVRAGDVVLIPAGVGHKNLGASADLLVVGAYPPGQMWDLCRGAPGERPQVLTNIQAVPLPATDPVYGATGPRHVHWP
ncbi:MAG: cupin domain-containing protein, partial [Litorilinea sp.]